jgi:hypothetical protein
MGMENFKSFGKKIGRKVGIGVMAATSLAGMANASQLEIAKAQTAATMAKFDAENPKATKAQRNAVLAEAKVKEAQAKDADEKGTTGAKPIPPVGLYKRNDADIKHVHNKVEIRRDKDGNVIGDVEEREESTDKLPKKEVYVVDKTNPNNPVLMTPGGTVPLEGRRGTPETNNGQFPQMWGRGQ